MGPEIDSGSLMHYRVNFLIYVVTCLFSLTQAVQGSIFFAGVTVLTCILAILIGTLIVHAIVEQDIKTMEDAEEEEKSSKENPEESTDKD